MYRGSETENWWKNKKHVSRFWYLNVEKNTGKTREQRRRRNQNLEIRHMRLRLLGHILCFTKQAVKTSNDLEVSWKCDPWKWHNRKQKILKPQENPPRDQKYKKEILNMAVCDLSTTKNYCYITVCKQKRRNLQNEKWLTSDLIMEPWANPLSNVDLFRIMASSIS